LIRMITRKTGKILHNDIADFFLPMLLAELQHFLKSGALSWGHGKVRGMRTGPCLVIVIAFVLGASRCLQRVGRNSDCRRPGQALCAGVRRVANMDTPLRPLSDKPFTSGRQVLSLVR
jgi:hypothetical protein